MSLKICIIYGIPMAQQSLVGQSPLIMEASQQYWCKIQ
jgi:hypothetical protein